MSTNTSEDRLADLHQREEPALAAELAALRVCVAQAVYRVYEEER